MKKLILLLSALWGFTIVVSGQPSIYSYAPQLQAFNKKVKAENISDNPGYALLVIQGDSVIYQSDAGVTSLESHDPINEHTSFNIASISKTFTAVAILKLHEEGKLNLTDKVGTYLPDLPDYIKDVQVYHLLTHTSGVPDYERGQGYPLATNRDVINYLSGRDSLDFSPLTDYTYSNSAYILLALVIEKVTGRKYEQFLKDSFFNPLGMQDTFVAGNNRVNSDNRAIGYSFDEDKKTFVLDDSRDDYTYGSTGIYSSVTDLFKWYKALKNGKILSKSSLDLMYHYPVTTSGKFSWMAMGWFNETLGRHTPELQGLKKRGAIGVTYGFRGMMEMYEGHDFGYICLTNAGEFPSFIGAELAKHFFE